MLPLGHDLLLRPSIHVVSIMENNEITVVLKFDGSLLAKNMAEIANIIRKSMGLPPLPASPPSQAAIEHDAQVPHSVNPRVAGRSKPYRDPALPVQVKAPPLRSTWLCVCTKTVLAHEKFCPSCGRARKEGDWTGHYAP